MPLSAFELSFDLDLQVLLLSRCQGRCRGVEAAVEVFEAAVEEFEAAVEVLRPLSRCSRPLSKCRGYCQGVKAAAEVRGRCRGIEAAVEALNSCRVPWRLTPHSHSTTL
jgi:4-hydroxy-3-methylbut-2-enyl diphosphate reductase IspH